MLLLGQGSRGLFLDHRHQANIIVTIQYGVSQPIHLDLKPISAFQYFFPNALNSGRMVRDFFETYAKGTFQFESLPHSFFFVLIVGESLPLRINRMHWSTWKDSFVYDGSPVGWVLGPSAWIFAHNVEDLDDFSNRKLASREWNLFEVFSEREFGEILCRQEPLTCNWLDYPVAWDDRPFWERLLQLQFVSVFSLALGTDLVATALVEEDANSAKIMDLLAEGSSFRALWHKEKDRYPSY